MGSQNDPTFAKYVEQTVPDNEAKLNVNTIDTDDSRFRFGPSGVRGLYHSVLESNAQHTEGAAQK